MRWMFNVDVVGRCNLRCPSCPVGNMPEVKTPSGFMPPELLEAIVDKARAECGQVSFSLYNWTEPFLHPHLAEMVRIVRRTGSRCGISSNFNIIKNIDEVMAADPSYLKLSVSGFDQERYGVTHRRGDIEVVKANMRRVAEARDRMAASTRIRVPFHRYLGNHEDERRMKEYAESLGFEFEPAWAYLMPLEKGLALAEPEQTDVVLTDGDRELIDGLALPMEEAIAVARSSGEERCRLRDRQMAITSEGQVMLCCAVYDPEHYQLGSYLDTPLEELQARKFRHPQCASCMSNGLHVLYTYGTDEFDRLALARERERRPDARRPRAETPTRTALRTWPGRVRRGVRRWGRRLSARP